MTSAGAGCGPSVPASRRVVPRLLEVLARLTGIGSKRPAAERANCMRGNPDPQRQNDRRLPDACRHPPKLIVQRPAAPPNLVGKPPRRPNPNLSQALATGGRVPASASWRRSPKEIPSEALSDARRLNVLARSAPRLSLSLARVGRYGLAGAEASASR
jgi:hypothetical protein